MYVFSQCSCDWLSATSLPCKLRKLNDEIRSKDSSINADLLPHCIKAIYKVNGNLAYYIFHSTSNTCHPLQDLERHSARQVQLKFLLRAVFDRTRPTTSLTTAKASFFFVFVFTEHTVNTTFLSLIHLVSQIIIIFFVYSSKQVQAVADI